MKYENPKIYPLELYHGPTIPPTRPCWLWPSDDDYDYDDICIMMKCVFVTFLLIPSPRWVFIVFNSFILVPGRFFMVFGRLLWLFMVPGWFFMVPGRFLWLFMVPGWFFMVPGRFLCLSMVSCHAIPCHTKSDNF